MKTTYFGGGSGSGGAVSSVFGRIGAVVAALGDYTSDLISNSSAVAGATVTNALNNLAAIVSNASKGLAPQFPGATNTVLQSDGTTPSWNSYLALDNNHALSGTIRLANGSVITMRGAGGTSDFDVLKNIAGGRLTLSTETDVGGIQLNGAAGALLFGVSVVPGQAVCTLTSRQSCVGIMQFDDFNGAVDCALQIRAGTSSSGRQLILGGQQALNIGGNAVIASGNASGGGSGKQGRIVGQLGGYIDALAGGTSRRIFEAANLGTNSAPAAVMGLFRSVDLTTTEVPNGDGLLYVADAAVIPTGSPASGHEYYSDGQRPAWLLGNGTNIRMNGVSTTATAGALPALPALPAGYLDVQINGVQRKVPFYAA